MSETATTAVHGKTYDETASIAMKQLKNFYGARDFKIYRSSAEAVGTVTGEILGWSVVFEAELS